MIGKHMTYQKMKEFNKNKNNNYFITKHNEKQKCCYKLLDKEYTQMFSYCTYYKNNYCCYDIYLNMYKKENETFNQFRQRMFCEKFYDKTSNCMFSIKNLSDSYHQERLKMKEINNIANYQSKKGIHLFDLLKECCEWCEMPPIENVTFSNFRWLRKDGDSMWFVAETSDNLYECHAYS